MKNVASLSLMKRHIVRSVNPLHSLLLSILLHVYDVFECMTRNTCVSTMSLLYVVLVLLVFNCDAESAKMSSKVRLIIAILH